MNLLKSYRIFRMKTPNKHIFISEPEILSENSISKGQITTIWHVLRKNRVWGGTQKVDPQISS